eukprot:CAMPEP_0174379018 /NCGR_PEP_ID=MMETSP0811_2-20130205/122426_1 /TAXON_ID=73025 ORGANISM="Eutreptiella gymnastica-like, Strain CCMP1594" /NCGR_SAMPLE_ID=MMETSP0811_2 /ASSEMBLY_ACC=CAM_ASM_000667 /LENGTH=48 /DNA_ID= /DNA_START= /DNA_END= /DNA_ORIENTATION=
MALWRVRERQRASGVLYIERLTPHQHKHAPSIAHHSPFGAPFGGGEAE